MNYLGNRADGNFFLCVHFNKFSDPVLPVLKKFNDFFCLQIPIQSMSFLKTPILKIIKMLQPSKVHLLLGEKSLVMLRKKKSNILNNNLGSDSFFFFFFTDETT